MRPAAAFRTAAAVVLISASASRAIAQTSPAPAPASTTWTLRDWSRVEMWRFFEPPAGGGNDDYAFGANRLFAGVQRTARAYDFTAALQYVQFGGLPSDAVGPGPLGTGAVYYAHAGRSDSRQVYLRYANIRVKRLIPRTTIQIGRMAYASGNEAVSGNSKIEAVRTQHVFARLIGEFGWSIYQRAYDGVRVDTARSRWTATGFAFHPTQGGFEDAAGLMMPGVTVLGAAATVNPAPSTRSAPSGQAPAIQYQAFAYRYRDTRRVTQRPDNTGRTATAADVGINTFGVTVITAPPPRNGRQWDALLWVAAQTGSWYEQTHRAASVAAELGHQWTAARWQPWLRGGYLYASGDGDPSDNRHGTFFEMLPTVRQYAQSALYSQMNNTDLFAQLLARPRPNINVRFDWHRVGLASSRDGWYFGSGATQEHGSIFGFATRPSFGATHLATIEEGSIDYAIQPHWSIGGYLAVGRGGGVVTPAFAGQTLTFAFIENVVQF
ncbi:MAG TPA: alginate export family protein [Vicinamibacterales bacterium]|jgi:hypothetical protein